MFETVTPPRVVQLQAGESQLKLKSSRANLIMISNHGGVEILIGQSTNVQTYPWQRVGASPSSNMILLQSAGVNPYVYVTSAIEATVAEYFSSDVTPVMAFQVVATIVQQVTADVTDRAARQVGKVGMLVAGNDVGPGNRVPVDLGGATINAGNIYTQVTAVPADASNPDSLVIAGTTDGAIPAGGGANVGWMRVVAGKLWISLQEIAAGVLFDVSDRAARMLGKVGIQIGGADVGPANPVPVDVTDEPNRQLGIVYPAGWSSVKVTAAAAGVQQVKAAAGQVGAILPLAAVSVTLQDGAAPAWDPLTAERDFSTHPIQCNTSIQLSFAAAGEVWVIYR